MAPTPRIFADYRAALTVTVEEEISGVSYFAALAGFHEGAARRALMTMSQIEAAMVAAVLPLAGRRGLTLPGVEALQAMGRVDAQTQAGQTWPQFLQHVHTDYPAYMDEFRQLSALAPDEDQAFVQLLTDHEQAFIDFAELERAGLPGAQAVLDRLLARNAIARHD